MISCQRVKYFGGDLTNLFFEVAGHGPSGKGKVSFSGAENQPIRVSYCR